MKKKTLLTAVIVTSVLFLYGCSDEKTPFEFDKQHAEGSPISITAANLAGTWRTRGLYSEYHNLTEISPSLRSGYIRLGADGKAAFCQDTVTKRPVYEGTVSYSALLDQNIVTMNMHEADDASNVMPEVQLEIRKLTATQMEAAWVHVDDNYVPYSASSAGLLVEYTFDNGSLTPITYHKSLQASELQGSGIEILTPFNKPDTIISSHSDKNIIGVPGSNVSGSGLGWVNDYVAKASTVNLHFRLTSEDYKIIVDSLSFVGFRIHKNPASAAGSELQFCTSPNFSEATLQSNGTKMVLAMNNDQVVETLTEPLTRSVKGNKLLLGLVSHNRSGTLYIKGIRVYGRLTLGERFYYEYIFDKEKPVG